MGEKDEIGLREQLFLILVLIALRSRFDVIGKTIIMLFGMYEERLLIKYYELSKN